MFGCNWKSLSFFLILCVAGFSDEDLSLKKRVGNRRTFFSVSVSHWQEATQIVQHSGPNYDINSTQLALGAGIGYVGSYRYFSWVIQGQLFYATSDHGFRPEEIAGVDFSGQNLSLLGARLDGSLLFRLDEGVGIGFGIPVVGSLFLNKTFAPGFSLSKKAPVGVGGFLGFRLRKDDFVFYPKIGFINDTKNYFASADFNFHF